MTVKLCVCGECKHLRSNRDGWIMNCDAFPDEIPDKYVFELNPKEIEECNNGIKFEPKEK